MTLAAAGAFCLGLLAGGAVLWLILSSRFHARLAEAEGRAAASDALARERATVIDRKDSELHRQGLQLDAEKELRTRMEESRKALQEEVGRLREIRQEFSDAFRAISLDALKGNSEEFLKLARTALEAQALKGSEELDKKKALIDQDVEAIEKVLSEIGKRIEEVGRGNASIGTLLQHHSELTSRLRETTERLGSALVSAKKRGEWGERMAEDVIRLVGMAEGINYVKQKTLDSTSGRPDYTFLLPNGLRINMDVKFPLDNFVRYLNAESDHDRRRFREELLRNTRTMIRQVTGREYINPVENTVDYVLIFIPNEQVYGFINDADPAIMDDALRQKVILCSPFTLYAVLAVIRQAVENFNLERTASEILTLLTDFSKQWAAYKDRFRIMGERLEAAKREYDVLATTRTNTLERSLRKIDELSKEKLCLAWEPPENGP